MPEPRNELLSHIQDFEQLLKQNDNIVSAIAATFKLPPVLASILSLLLSMPLVTSEVMAARVNVITESKISIHRLRKHMQDYGMKIQSKRRVGYWLDNKTKDRISRLVIAHIKPSALQLEAMHLVNGEGEEERVDDHMPLLWLDDNFQG